MPHYVYILECADGSYYTGSTSDLNARFEQHQSGDNTSAYTYSRRPVKLVWFDEFPSIDEALKCERQIKGWRRIKKEALIRGDWDKIHQIVLKERRRREKRKQGKQ